MNAASEMIPPQPVGGRIFRKRTFVAACAAQDRALRISEFNSEAARQRMSMMTALQATALASLMFVIGMSGAAAAPKAHPANPHRDPEILFLGTAGGPPLRLDRSEPSTLLIVDGREYLIDCGIGTMRRMVEAGIRSEQVKTIFLTHLHADHDLGLADVMANDFLYASPTATAEPVNIYGPPQTADLVDAAFHFITIGFRPFAAENPAAYRIVNGAFASPFVAHEFNRDGVIFQDSRIRVSAAENSHYALMSRQQRKEMKSYSYRVTTRYGAIVFTGDTGPSDGVARLAKGADVLVAEASYRDQKDLDQLVDSMARRFHWSPKRARAFRAHFQFEHLDTERVGQLATEAGVKAVVLYHYDPVGKADQAAYVMGVKRYFTGAVFAPVDLDRYCLGKGIVRPCLQQRVPFSNGR
jgi:ribonuclease BN (tRNA processing enzyme)